MHRLRLASITGARSLRGALALVALVGFAGACSSPATVAEAKSDRTERPDDLSLATFAGGCFWCMEPPFEKLDGVWDAISGYAGGPEANPTYKQVASGRTGHTEAVQIHYDPERISYAELLDVFWRAHDPTDPNGQFVDRGRQYRPAIFAHDEAQRAAAETSRDALAASGRFDRPIATEIVALERFWQAEDYHQDYYEKEPIHYKMYRAGSGRDAFLKKVWGDDLEPARRPRAYTKPPADVLRERLTELQWHVTQEDGTELAFRNSYWDNTEPGIYVDVVSGEPLFSSTDKYKSGTGWPSFTRPLEADHIVEHADYKLGMRRIEVRSQHGDSHLGHVFSDGPPPTGLRYCINSASLRFVPVADLEREGYGRYARLFAAD